MAQANAVPEEVDEKDIMGRVDYRNEITFTIDGADAKDLDDAVKTALGLKEGQELLLNHPVGHEKK